MEAGHCFSTISDEQHSWERFQTVRNLKQNRQIDFASAAEKMLYELLENATIARLFEMQILLDTLKNEERSFILHGTPRTVEDRSLLWEKDEFKTRLVIDRQRPRPREIQNNRRWYPGRPTTPTLETASTPQPMDIGAVTCCLCGGKGRLQTQLLKTQESQQATKPWHIEGGSRQSGKCQSHD